MLIAGAKRHAKEILQIFVNKGVMDNLCFFDDVSTDIGNKLYGRFPVLKSLDAAKTYFQLTPEFVLALGKPKLRKTLAEKLYAQGGSLISIIADSAYVGDFGVELSKGLNIMHCAMISNDVQIGEGTLINAFASIHHDVIIGEYCEISPHATLLGGCRIGDFTSVGANATILPDVQIGKYVQIGAGAVVNKDLPDNCVAVGVPARIIKEYE